MGCWSTPLDRSFRSRLSVHLSYFFVNKYHERHEMLQNRLQPFEPEPLLRLRIVPCSHVDFPGTADTAKEFGFTPRSKQARFFDQEGDGNVVALLYRDKGGPPPTSMTDASVVCRLFGSVDRNVLTLWHVSVNHANSLNDSDQGRRWGVYNIRRDTSGKKVRWRTSEGARITPRNAGAHIRGTPNPYAVECLVRAAERLKVDSIEQHSDMPCARLFNSEYDHRTHPATYLIYKALGFTNTMGHFVWYSSEDPSLMHSYRRTLRMMEQGINPVE